MNMCLKRVDDRHFWTPGVFSYAMKPRCHPNSRVFFPFVTSVVYALTPQIRNSFSPFHYYNFFSFLVLTALDDGRNGEVAEEADLNESAESATLLLSDDDEPGPSRPASSSNRRARSGKNATSSASDVHLLLNLADDDDDVVEEVSQQVLAGRGNDLWADVSQRTGLARSPSIRAAGAGPSPGAKRKRNDGAGDDGGDPEFLVGLKRTLTNTNARYSV
jgi:hypothetical protein